MATVATAASGPCPAPGKQPAAAVVASVAAAGLASHPVGAFFATAGAPGAVSAAAGRADLRVASASDMQRFAAEGFLLAGPARLGEFEVTKPASSPSGGVRAAQEVTSGRSPVHTVRILPQEGLVYVSASALPFDAATAAQSASTPSSRPDRQAALAEAAAARDAQPEGVAAAAVAARGGPAANPKRKNLAAPGWVEIKDLSRHPYTAVGWLNLGYEGGAGYCSGSLIAKHAVVTAAHCVYDRGSGSSLSTAVFYPHNFYTSKLKLQQPFGSAKAYAFDFLSGWSTEDDMDKAWISDMAVILLVKDAGTASGTLGYAYNAAGYSGQIYLAGYPGETPSVIGEYFKLKGKCFIQDTNGADAAIDMREPNQRTCLTDCSIAERGQSGQPAFVQNGTSWVVRGVLSHGPPTGQCYGYDTYTEVDAMHYKFLDQYRLWTPPANATATP
ncbi:hypothetical protein MNEG_6243 [Monoraphidium neglectum]|uniref:Peptidase S1 domain-containing protein n=1 Tax=Monoraphidium neglectum TaxID=145388 RepID=A0A0D2JRW0_9CHLO|nr:hypothetical protein MNEG_6243 [Monoraphidium neglectum]KIZ01718.1 hypothetical protein MNEG_6243 [Monoraphidium neglectum]|eukprot:XP_013900737.1 hypothetical protein MNEG_6243 [Monoraphidium neglectum]